MSLKKFSLWALMLVLGLGLAATGALQTAEAKRIGGGSNLGQQKHSYSRQATAPTAAPAGTTAAPAKATPNGNRWLGPLAGLAAGGLLAALFFGGAFDGMTPADFIILLILGVGAFFLIRALRNKSRSAEPAYAGHPSNTASANARTAASSVYSGSAPAAELGQVPAWFNEAQFIQAAKNHFTNLQKSWDNNDMNAMREYFTPALFAELSQERARIGDEFNVTEVQSLGAQLLDLSHEQGDVVASVLFQGTVRENYGQPETIAEVWHVRHSADSSQGDWLIAGIQQYQHLVHG